MNHDLYVVVHSITKAAVAELWKDFLQFINTSKKKMSFHYTDLKLLSPTWLKSFPSSAGTPPQFRPTTPWIQESLWVYKHDIPPCSRMYCPLPPAHWTCKLLIPIDHILSYITALYLWHGISQLGQIMYFSFSL